MWPRPICPKFIIALQPLSLIDTIIFTKEHTNQRVARPMHFFYKFDSLVFCKSNNVCKVVRYVVAPVYSMWLFVFHPTCHAVYMQYLRVSRRLCVCAHLKTTHLHYIIRPIIGHLTYNYYSKSYVIPTFNWQGLFIHRIV